MKIEKQSAKDMGSIMQSYIRAMHLSASHNSHRVYVAWEEASGAAPYTIRRFYSKGKLTITLSSSVMRSQLFLQREFLIARMNSILEQDELFIRDEPNTGFVKELILK